MRLCRYELCKNPEARACLVCSRNCTEAISSCGIRDGERVVRDAVHRLWRTAFCPASCIVVKRFTFTLRRESLERRGGMIALAAGRR